MNSLKLLFGCALSLVSLETHAKTLDKESILDLQKCLQTIDYFSGIADGYMSDTTRDGVMKTRQWQRDKFFYEIDMDAPITSKDLRACRTVKRAKSNTHAESRPIAEKSITNQRKEALPIHLESHKGAKFCKTDEDKRILRLKADVIAAQLRLSALSYNVGKIDGVMGSKTTAALKVFQTGWPLPVTGNLELCTAKALIQAINNLPPDRKPKPNPFLKRRPGATNSKPGNNLAQREDPRISWTTDPWNTKRISTSRLAQIHNSLLKGTAGPSIIPRDAIPIKNQRDFEQLTRNGVLIFYKARVRASGSSRKEFLAHSGWNHYTDTHKVYLNPTESRPFRRDLKNRNLEHCEIDRDFSNPLTFCYRFYRDAIYPDLVYAKGLDKRQGVNNGRAKGKEWIFQLSNEGSIDELAQTNRSKYGENYQIPVPAANVLFELLQLGQKLEYSLRSNAANGCAEGAIRDSVNGGFCPGKEPIPGKDY